jgi:hypothetical protein
MIVLAMRQRFRAFVKCQIAPPYSEQPHCYHGPLTMSGDEGTSTALYDGSISGLMDFLSHAKAKGMLAARTADAYRSACMCILSMQGEGWERTSLGDLNLELQVESYARRPGASVKLATLVTYRQRLQAAIELYKEFLDDPAGFQGPAKGRRSPVASSAEPVTGVVLAARTEDVATPRFSNASSLVTYPFPLRSGALAFLHLPRDLSFSDVRRLCAFLESLAMDRSAEST